MFFCRRCAVLFLFLFSIGGCAKRVMVPIEDIEKGNDVEIQLKTGESVTGSVVKDEPHQLVLFRDGRLSVPITKTDIRTIKRKPPIYDDLGKPISEVEIEKEITHRNALIYGCGGGLMTVGGSFFVGSLLANESEASGALAATVGVGGGLGTVLFTRAGMAKDRHDAIERINRNRQLAVEVKQDERPAKESDSLQDQLIQEKQKQDELRKERERLLRELEDNRQTNP